jgi:hypothetical protein
MNQIAIPVKAQSATILAKAPDPNRPVLIAITAQTADAAKKKRDRVGAESSGIVSIGKSINTHHGA